MDNAHPTQSNTAAGLTRRQALGLGTAAAAAALAPATRVRADDHAAPVNAEPQLSQGAGYYRLNLGGVEVTLLSDGSFPFDPAAIGTNADPEQVNAALHHAFVPRDHILGQVNTLLINTGQRLILIDAGCGNSFGPTTGKLREHLTRLGADPGDIDLVVLSHLHVDHIGGLITDAGIDWLPNAKFVMHQAERDFWAAESPDLSKTGVPEEMWGFFVDVAQAAINNIPADRLELVTDKRTQLDDALAVYHTPGHTPGHLVAGLYGEAGQFGYLADLIHFAPVQFAHPDWHIAFDTDPVEAAGTRKRILEYYAKERKPVAGAHLPFPGVGHVRAAGDAFEYVPVVWQWDPAASAPYQSV
ncbi:MAG: MBL fold metallo-hydrolase [Planctomycetota bacterium]